MIDFEIMMHMMMASKPKATNPDKGIIEDN
jgi:hypothetical protein